MSDTADPIRVVLVEGPALRRDLESQLRRQGLEVIATPRAVLGLTLAGDPPALVVCGDSDQVRQVKEIVRRSSESTPLVTIANWPPSRVRRAVEDGLVEDVIPADLPSAGVAYRVRRLARRSLDGIPLRSPSLLPGRKPRVRLNRNTEAPPARQQERTLTSRPEATAQRRSSPPRVSAPRPSPNEHASEAQDLPAAQRPLPAQRPTLDASDHRAAASAVRGASAASAARAVRPVPAARAPTQTHPRGLKDHEAERPSDPDFDEVRQEALAMQQEALAMWQEATQQDWAEPQAERSRVPDEDNPRDWAQISQDWTESAYPPIAAHGKRERRRHTPPPLPAVVRPPAPEDPTTDQPEEPTGRRAHTTSVRVPLANGAQHLGGVRVAIADADITRADAVAVALRARRAEVHLASLDPSRTHWKLMRKFAPHALLLDEKVFAEQAREFLGKVRHDPFLQHTQLLTVRFDRLFRPESGVASIETIRPLLEPLGRAESTLLAKLNPYCEVEFDLDQIPPHMLLKMLAPRSETTRIECVRGKERLLWTIGGGKAGHALLWDAREQATRLDADDALDWLLHHHNCHVVVTQSAEQDELSGCDLLPFVEQKISGNWKALTDTETRELRRTPERSVAESEVESADPTTPPLPEEEPVPVYQFESPPATSVTKRPERRGRSRGRLAIVAAGTAIAAGSLAAMFTDGMAKQNWSEGTSSAATPSSSTAAPDGVPNPEQPKPDAEPGEADGERSETQAADESSPEEEAAEEAARLFAVDDRNFPSCQAVLEGWQPATDQHPAQATIYWRKAQRMLVDGKNAEAHRELCKSATLDPSGKGSEHLAQFYLGQRSLAHAEKWVTAVLDARPDDDAARELYGDIINQRGRVAESRAQWLEVLGVAEEEDKKLAAVSQVWLGHARRAFSAGDYPRAERKLRRALALAPENAAAARLLTEVFVRLGDEEQANAWSQYAAELE